MLPLLIAGKMLGGTIGAYAQYKQLRNQADAADYEAKISDYNAGLSRQQGIYEAQRVRKQGLEALGSIRASYGASGVTMEGSATDVIQNSAAEVERDVLLTKYKAEINAWQFDQQASVKRNFASSTRGQANLAFIGGTLSSLTGAMPNA